MKPDDERQVEKGFNMHVRVHCSRTWPTCEEVNVVGAVRDEKQRMIQPI